MPLPADTSKEQAILRAEEALARYNYLARQYALEVLAFGFLLSGLDKIRLAVCLFGGATHDNEYDHASQLFQEGAGSYGRRGAHAATIASYALQMAEVCAFKLNHAGFVKALELCRPWVMRLPRRHQYSFAYAKHVDDYELWSQDLVTSRRLRL